MTVRRRSSASTNGSRTSRLAPIPFISSSAGTAVSVPGRTDTRSVRPPDVTVRRNSPPPPGDDETGLLVEDIGARRVGEFLQLPGPRRRRDLLPRPLAEPGHEVGPPGALDRLRLLEPLLRVGGGVAGDLEGRLRVSRRVDERGDMAARGQDEPVVPAQKLGGAVAGLPRAQVIGDAGGHV